ncbi:MAG: hypothetical protein ACYDAB_09925 [bacterium]
MAGSTLEIRMAHLEGAYEQIDRRLGSLERRMDDGFIQLRTEITGVDQRLNQKLDTHFRWLIGIILINWITVVLAIFNKH